MCVCVCVCVYVCVCKRERDRERDREIGEKGKKNCNRERPKKEQQVDGGCGACQPPRDSCKNFLKVQASACSCLSVSLLATLGAAKAR